MTYQELRDTYGVDAFKIYAHMDFESKFLDPTKPPKDINFKYGLPDLKPQQQIEMTSGEVSNAKYYAREENDIYSHPLAMVEFVWTRVDAGNGETILRHRQATACWSKVGQNDDEVIWGKQVSEIKTWPKKYNDKTGRLADQRKRRNIIDQLISQVSAFPVLHFVQDMLNTLDDQQNGYVGTYDVRFIESIASYEGDWLETDLSPVLTYLPPGTTLRQAILGALDYDNKVLGQ